MRFSLASLWVDIQRTAPFSFLLPISNQLGTSFTASTVVQATMRIEIVKSWKKQDLNHLKVLLREQSKLNSGKMWKIPINTENEWWMRKIKNVICDLFWKKFWKVIYENLTNLRQNLEKFRSLIKIPEKKLTSHLFLLLQ